MLTTPSQVRRMSFNAIERELLNDAHRFVLALALKRGSLDHESFYFNPDPAPKDAWDNLRHWGFFATKPGADTARTTTPWRLTRMGYALACHLKKEAA
jgi:hypothetical protein